MYTLVELCCGGAALTLHQCGARRPLVPYQGGKWRFRAALGRLLEEGGFLGPPRHVELSDPSAWGTASPTVIRGSSRARLIERLDALSRHDARAIFDSFQGQRVPDDPLEFSAQFLFLQRLSYSGKAVGVREGRWRSPGFNSSSAYGILGTERFGTVLPMIPSLVKTLRSYSSISEPDSLVSHRREARGPHTSACDRTIVYLDPPYAGSTNYPDAELTRPQVVALARAWEEAGASVMISESTPLPELLAEGWHAESIYQGRKDTSPFRGKQQEWVTLSPRWRANG